MLWRHGDVLIASINAIPAQARRRSGSILFMGEATGHAHRVEDPTKAEILVERGELFLRVLEATRILHEEHQPIALPAGAYRVWQQREYTPQVIRRMAD